MRRIWLWTAVGVMPGLWLAHVAASDPVGKAVKPSAAVKPADNDEESGCHGTAVQFVETPSAAARQALREQKLVFVLHVSGHFEDPGLT